MRTVTLFTNGELADIATRAAREDKGEVKSWDLEIGRMEWPRLHVHYYHPDDGQGMHIRVVDLDRCA